MCVSECECVSECVSLSISCTISSRRLNEGSEHILFREKFSDWPEQGRIIKMKGHTMTPVVRLMNTHNGGRERGREGGRGRGRGRKKCERGGEVKERDGRWREGGRRESGREAIGTSMDA